MLIDMEDSEKLFTKYCLVQNMDTGCWYTCPLEHKEEAWRILAEISECGCGCCPVPEFPKYLKKIDNLDDFVFSNPQNYG